MTDKLTVREFTTQLEKGDGSHATEFFNNKFEEERFKDLDAIRKLNEQDKAQGKTQTTVECYKDIYYTDNIDIIAGGKNVYSDRLDLHTLQHTDPSDKSPALTPFNARTLTSALEFDGDGKALLIALDGMRQEERANVLNQVEKQNQSDLQLRKTTATLGISVAGSKHSASDIWVDRSLAGMHDLFFGGQQIYFEHLDLESGKRDVVATIDARK